MIKNVTSYVVAEGTSGEREFKDYADAKAYEKLLKPENDMNDLIYEYEEHAGWFIGLHIFDEPFMVCLEGKHHSVPYLVRSREEMIDVYVDIFRACVDYYDEEDALVAMEMQKTDNDLGMMGMVISRSAKGHEYEKIEARYFANVGNP